MLLLSPDVLPNAACAVGNMAVVGSVVAGTRKDDAELPKLFSCLILFVIETCGGIWSRAAELTDALLV